eukprot:TRINITY_DN59787_c0_g1_i1.p1 TRINITY_DN59787_c0_g1~~TRINITY_DN59787_c0_g1_i1.p1  ORF type:complete len:469 (+),score=126.65 TRINITY_DN59787_c0_g1_i1:57-1463(+)
MVEAERLDEDSGPEANPHRALLLAVSRCDFEEAASLLEQRAAPMARDAVGETPLHAVARWGDLEMARRLLGVGDTGMFEMVNAVSSKGKTPLDVAVESKNPDCATLLLEKQAELALVPNRYPSALHYASACGLTSVARSLLDAAAPPDGGTASSSLAVPMPSPLELALTTDRAGVATLLLQRKAWQLASGGYESAVHCATRHNATNVLMQLLGEGETINAKAGGRMPLHVAVRFGIDATVHTVLRAGARVDAIEDDEGCSPLMFALRYGASDSIIEDLLMFGAPANIPAHDGSIGLHAAAAAGRLETLAVLLEKRQFTAAAACDLDTPTKDGSTALHYAVRFGHLGAVEQLLQAKASPDVPASAGDGSGDGRTPLHAAAQFGSVEIVRVLLACGASPNVREKLHGQTPLHTAVQFNQLQAAKCLLEGRADLAKHCPAPGVVFCRWTPLELAIRCGHPEMEQLITKVAG